MPTGLVIELQQVDLRVGSATLSQRPFEVIAIVIVQYVGQIKRRESLIVELDRRAVKLSNLHHQIFNVFAGDVLGQVVQPDLFRKPDYVHDAFDPQSLLNSVVGVIAQPDGESSEHGMPPSLEVIPRSQSCAPRSPIARKKAKKRN
ncbi:hypothetical protein MPLSOD_40300 [Mesorhizobium sp. SOD10]|nr:hypothetical protein MPLSOD_40300 [Mesorhizobium sp. SOD10]